jgi:hypothetical protein
MGLFGDDKRQDDRLDALESHVRIVTEAVRENQLDIASSQILLLEMQAWMGQLQTQLGKKVSVDEVDPLMAELNEHLGSAREQLQKASAAADESWGTLQSGMHDSFETLRSSVRNASETLKSV